MQRRGVRFSVIIPVWNQLHFSKKLAECLDADRPGDWEAVWINNGSADGTGGFLRGLDGARHRFVEFGENRGFGAACNAGAAEAEGAYLVFLNNDTEPEPGLLADLVACLEADPAVGALLPRATGAVNLSFKRADRRRGVEPMRPFGRIPSGVCVAMAKSLFFEWDASTWPTAWPAARTPTCSARSGRPAGTSPCTTAGA